MSNNRVREYFVKDFDELHRQMKADGVKSFNDAMVTEGDNHMNLVMVSDVTYFDYAIPKCLQDIEYKFDRRYQ